MIKITNSILLNDDEIVESFIRSPGPGGQNVNKVETAVQIRFDARQCSALNDGVYQRLKNLASHLITAEGVLVITANKFRSQARNRQDALDRLTDLIRKAAIIPKSRRATKPTRASKTRRLEGKKHQGKVKKMRGKKISHD